VLTGVSAGALNSCGLGAFEPNESADAASFIFGLWNSLTGTDVYQTWTGGLIAGVFWKHGIFDNSPLTKFVNNQVKGRVVKRKVSFGTVDANNADYVIYDYNATNTLPSDYVDSAIASASIPFAFPQLVRGDKVLIDGGSVWNLDLSSAVRRCKEIVDDESDIIVDMILCSNNKVKIVENIKEFSTLENFMRGREIMSFYEGMDEIEKSRILYPKVNWRYVVAPSEELSESIIPLDFSKDHLDKCFAVGKKDAINAVKLGEGGNYEVIKEYAKRSRRGENVNLADMIEDKIIQRNATLMSS